jgi:hypothetical protein
VSTFPSAFNYNLGMSDVTRILMAMEQGDPAHDAKKK